MADQQFCLRWNNHQSTLISVFDTLLENGTLVDCTLAAEGQYLKAHKVVLCACSPYLETLLSQHYEKHPIVILKDVKFSELKSMMDYMYRGEVNISQDQLGTFLKAAESLQIKGLSDNGADGDARDVGSTSKVPQRKPNQSVTTTRPTDSAPESPAHRSRDGSISPTSRKRRRIRRNSQGDDSNVGDSHLDTSNSCDLPSQAQIPIVPNIPASVTSSITTTPIMKTPIIKPEQTEIVNRLDSSNINSLPPPESGLLKEKIEPSEPLLEPKTEYLEDVNTEDSVEDLTLDDDDEMDGMDISNMSSMSNMSRPGPSHGNDLSNISNQGFAPWQLGGNQSGTDEVFMAAQEAVSAHRDSQDNESAVSIIRSGTTSNKNVENQQQNKEKDPVVVAQSSEQVKSPVGELQEKESSKKSSRNTVPECEASTSYQSSEVDPLQPSDDVEFDPSTKEEIQSTPKRKGKKKNEPMCTDVESDQPNTNEEDKRQEEIQSTPPKRKSKNLKKIEPLCDDAGTDQPSMKVQGESWDEIQSTPPKRKDKNLKKNEPDDVKTDQPSTKAEDESWEEIQSTPPKKKGKSLKKNECEFCGRHYKYPRGLAQHQRLECGREPQFPCPYCPQKFRYRHLIRNHVRDEHHLAYPRWYRLYYETSKLSKGPVKVKCEPDQ